jgi:hypothetical protein
LYVARRYLKLSPQEWGELPWWVQQTYVDGFIHEGLLVTSDEVSEAEKDVPQTLDPVMASDGDLRRMGLTVIDGG